MNSLRQEERKRMMRSDRGVALLITLLVTTILIALVFEFAYGTRVSLRAAANFRDGQRAYFLARSGVNFAGKLLAENLKQGKKQDNLEQREWQVVPIVSAGDMELRVRWEDETGKINIASLSNTEIQARLERLFGIKQIGLDVLDRLKDLKKVRLPGELHQVLSDEEYGNIRQFVTVWSGSNSIDINTAAPEVLRSLGMSESLASLVIERRQTEPFTTSASITNFPGMDASKSWLSPDSNVFLVQSHATVGGYTKQAEAVIKRELGTFSIVYWRIL